MKIKNIGLILVLLFVLPVTLNAQTSLEDEPTTSKKEKTYKKRIRLLNLEASSPTLTLDFQALKSRSAGIGIGIVTVQQHCEPLGRGIVLDNEFTFKNTNRNFVYSPRITYFLNKSWFYAGANLSYHTDFKNGGTLQIAPEIGLGIIIAYIVYSRNIPITKNNLIPVNKNNISLKLMLPLFF